MVQADSLPKVVLPARRDLIIPTRLPLVTRRRNSQHRDLARSCHACTRHAKHCWPAGLIRTPQLFPHGHACIGKGGKIDSLAPSL